MKPTSPPQGIGSQSLAVMITPCPLLPLTRPKAKVSPGGKVKEKERANHGAKEKAKEKAEVKESPGGKAKAKVKITARKEKVIKAMWLLQQDSMPMVVSFAELQTIGQEIVHRRKAKVKANHGRKAKVKGKGKSKGKGKGKDKGKGKGKGKP